MATGANAGTIIVQSTLATAGPNQHPLFAMFENSNALSTSKALADVASGHLGALVSSLPGGTALADAAITLGLAFQDMTADDFLTMNMSLHGTFTPGSGAEADFFVDDGNGVTNAATITCRSAGFLLGSGLVLAMLFSVKGKPRRHHGCSTGA